MIDVEVFVQSVTAQVKPLYRAYSLAEWEAATQGTAEANAKTQEAQAAYMRFWSDPQRYANARQFHEARVTRDPLLARQLKLIYLAATENQQDEATIQKLTALEADIRAEYYNYRGEVRGRRLSDNELDDILKKSTDAQLVRDAWEASKRVGAQVAGKVRELAKVRNAAAQQQGFRDYFQRQLTLSEIDEAELLTLFDRLENATTGPFMQLKAEIDQARAKRFGIKVSDLRPWHYGDRFFQEAPDMGDLDLDRFFADKDPVALSTRTYDDLGMEVRDILARSDLYARDGKDQHAFCTHIDREGDVRTLNNLQPNASWNGTLLHELGHGVYDKYIDLSLPWLLRTPPHTLSTEAIALMMGSLVNDAEWLRKYAGLSAAEAKRVAALAAARERAAQLIFTRWVLVMTNFERAMYANPDRDLDTLWWDLVEKYQLLTRPEGRQAPDWAAKVHVALFPVYYHNYELGHLVSAQLQNHLKRHAGGLVGKKKAGVWLRKNYFASGAKEDWAAHVQTATGEPLNPQYFVDRLG